MKILTLILLIVIGVCIIEVIFFTKFEDELWNDKKTNDEKQKNI